MSSASAWSAVLIGMQPTLVEVEAAIGNGLPKTVLVGLPDTALYQSRDRCTAAVASSGWQWPSALVTINLSPAGLPKAGTHFDLAIATAVLAAAGTVPAASAARTMMMGELGLDGRVRPVRGVLPALLAAQEAGFDRAIVPASQVGEAGLVTGMTVWGVRNLADLAEVLAGRPVLLAPDDMASDVVGEPAPALDLADVVGQQEAKFALEVAAAGRHHLFFHGPPGAGKTMLAERLTSLLPDLASRESLEVSALYSLAGRNLNDGLVSRPPFCSPHHKTSPAAIVGGGSRVPKPGQVSLAHRGVLFLDEAPEFPPSVLESLRTPLESGMVAIGRAAYEARYPARFQLVMAANPCPCGNHGTAGLMCRCSPMQVRRYGERISGPILDRIDLTHRLAPTRTSYLEIAGARGESSEVVRERVALARERQAHRLRGTSWMTNGEVPGHYLRDHLPLPDGVELLDEALVRGRVSSRGVDRVMRIAWTLCDLAGRDRPSRADVRGALELRRGETRAVA